MADEKHLEILERGIVAWNQWREDNPHCSDLSNDF